MSASPTRAVRSAMSESESMPVSQIAREAAVDRQLVRTVLASLSASQSAVEGPVGYWRLLTREETAQAREEARVAREEALRESHRLALLNVLRASGPVSVSLPDLIANITPPVRAARYKSASWRIDKPVRAPRHDFRPAQVRGLLEELIRDGRVTRVRGDISIKNGVLEFLDTYVASEFVRPLGAPRSRVKVTS